MQLTRAFDENQFAHMEDRINSLSELSVPHFNFEGTHEKRVSDQTFKGNVWVADFIFTSCPNQCPMLTAKMKLLQEEFKNISHFKMLSLSVAPEVDTAEVLLKYETKYQVNPENWYFARGPIEGVKNLLVNGFKLGTMDDPQFHTGKFVLIDPSNVIRGYYDPDNSESFEKLKNEIRKLLH